MTSQSNQKNFYYTEFNQIVSGVVESPLSIEDSKARLQATLDHSFGEGVATIREFREATPEEIGGAVPDDKDFDVTEVDEAETEGSNVVPFNTTKH